MGRIFGSASLWQHKAEETTAQQLIDSVNNSVGTIEWKTELIMGELRQVHEDLIKKEAETCTPQLLFLKNSLQIVEQKTDLILEELQLLRAGPQDFMTPELSLEGIKQFYVNVDSEQWKETALCYLQKILLINKNVVVFVNTHDKAKWLTDVLRDQNNVRALTIYGDMEQHTREDIMHQFRSGSSPMLISTDDILAPGLDIHYLQVSLVINYDLPTSPEKYLPHVGQSAWLKRKGFAINFTTRDDEKMLLDIQSFYNVAIEELPARVDDLIYDIYIYRRYTVLNRVLIH